MARKTREKETLSTTQVMIQALVELRRQPSALTAEHFWHLVQRFRADLVNQAFAVIGNQEDAEDVAQETLCQAFQDLRSLDDPYKLGIWLRKINRCNALDLYRKRRREKRKVSDRLPKSLAAPETTPTGSNMEVARRLRDEDLVARAVESLPEVYRSVVVLRYWEKMSYEEIAERLGVPVGTVRSRLSRADEILEKKLRRLWAKE